MSEQIRDLDTRPGDELLAELADDFLRRYRAGEHPSVDEYAKKHPALADRIRDLFTAAIAMEQPGGNATLEFHTGAERVGEVIGRYKLLERIGEGGFGVVYMAEQQQPVRRKVALKVIKPGMDTRQVVARFEAERQALAIMDHPNIAKVHDGGATTSGRPFFVMELVKGAPITEFCDANHLMPRQRLELFVPVCQAVQHAHHKGIVHRDLKPSNVLVTMHDTTPIVKVIDFGVAKALGQELTDKTLFTGFAEMIGTPLYMSPEQAGQSGLDIDTRSDIYSLGVLLYELLTGTTPFTKERFKQAAGDEIRRIIREEDPPKPSTRLSDLSSARQVPRLPTASSLASISARRQTEPVKLMKLMRGELDWIVMKALEKDRNRRYESASGFAMDVQRYLTDEPVQACPPSSAYRFKRFMRRNKGPVLAAALVLLTLIGGVIGTTFGLVSAEQARRAALDAETIAVLDRDKARIAHNNAETAFKSAERNLYSAYVILADRAWHSNEVALAQEYLANCPPALRHWEWHYLYRLCHSANLKLLGHKSIVNCVSYSPDGKWIATAGKNDPVRIWDAKTGKVVSVLKTRALCVAFSPDSQKLAVGIWGVEVWDVAGGNQLLTLKLTGTTSSVLFSSDGQSIAAAGKQNEFKRDFPSNLSNLKVWNANTGQETLNIPDIPGEVGSIAMSPDGTRIAGAIGRMKEGFVWRYDNEPSDAIIWDRSTGEEITSLHGHTKGVTCVTFSPDGKFIATTSFDNTVKLWSWDGEQIFSLPHDYVTCAAFSPDGARLASSGLDCTVRIWDVSNGHEILLRRHTDQLLSVTYSPDGLQVAAAAWDRDNSVQIWSAVDGLAATSLSANEIQLIFFDSNGRLLSVSSTDQNTATISDVLSDVEIVHLNTDIDRPVASRSRIVAHCGKTVDVGYARSRSGGTQMIPGVSTDVRLWDSVKGDELFALHVDEPCYTSAAVNPDGTRLVVASFYEKEKVCDVKVYDVGTKTLVSRFQHDVPPVSEIVFNPNGMSCAFIRNFGGVEVRDIETSRELYRVPGNSVAFTHDGTKVAVAQHSAVGILDATTGNQLLKIDSGGLWGGIKLAFSPDGHRLVTSHNWGPGSCIKIWNAETGVNLLTLPGAYKNVIFSPNGRQLVAISDDDTVMLWDAAPVSTETSKDIR